MASISRRRSCSSTRWATPSPHVAPWSTTPRPNECSCRRSARRRRHLLEGWRGVRSAGCSRTVAVGAQGWALETLPPAVRQTDAVCRWWEGRGPPVDTLPSDETDRVRAERGCPFDPLLRETDRDRGRRRRRGYPPRRRGPMTPQSPKSRRTPAFGRRGRSSPSLTTRLRSARS